MQKKHGITNQRKKESHMDAVPQNECGLSDFPSISQFSINHLKRILIIVIIIIIKARQRQWFCKVFLNIIAET